LSISRDSSRTFATQTFCYVLGFASSVVVARVLGPELKGVVAVTMLAPAMLALAVQLDLHFSMLYLPGKHEKEMPALLGNALATIIASGAIVLLGCWVLYEPLRQYLLPASDPDWLFAAILGVPAVVAAEIAMAAAVGLGRFDRYVMLYLVRNGLFPILTIVLVWAVGMEVGGVVVAFLATASLSALVGVALASRDLRWRLELDRRLAGEMISFAMRTFPGTVLSLVNWRVDILLLGILLDAKSMGVYSIAAMAQKLLFLPSAIGLAMIPKVTRFDEAERRDVVLRASRCTLWITAAAAVAGAGAAWLLVVPVFGEAFAGAIAPFWILLPGVLGIGLTRVLRNYLSAIDRPELASYSSAASLAVNISLGLLLIPRLELAGAAIAMTTAHLLYTLIVAVCFMRLSRSGPGEVFVLRRDDLRAMREALAKVAPGTQAPGGETP